MEILLDWYKYAVVFAPIGKPHKIPNKSVENQSRMPKRAEEIQICGNNKEKRKQKRQKKEKNRRFINRFSDL